MGQARLGEERFPAYETYELGTFDLKPELTVWVAPASNPKVKGVWVDRVYLVKAEQ